MVKEFFENVKQIYIWKIFREYNLFKYWNSIIMIGNEKYNTLNNSSVCLFRK